MRGDCVLQTVKKISDCEPAELIAVYRESLEEDGRRNYPKESDDVQKQLAIQDFYSYLRDFFRQDGALLFTWRSDNTCVSVLRAEPYRDGYLVTGLETAPDCRERGYAKHLLSHAAFYLHEDGVARIYSHVEKTNTASLTVHTACGFSCLWDVATLLDGTVTQRYYTLLHNKTAGM